jgi:hypothetical protein
MAHRWFMTAPDSRWTGSGDQRELVPLGTIHAKEMGTDTTACGLLCLAWPKYWERPFGATRDVERTCEACRTALGRH